jgi:hypothetical protein
LSDCGLDNADITAFAEIVPTMTSLFYLDVCSNDFDSTGAGALLEAIKSSESLEEVVLSGGQQHVDDSIRDAIFYTCKLREIRHGKLLAEALLSLYALILARLSDESWINVIYYLLRKKRDMLCQARMGKRTRSDDE